MINIENLDPKKIKMNEKSNKNIVIYQIGYVSVKDLSYEKYCSVNLLYLIMDKTNGYNKESNGNKDLKLAFTDKSKDAMEKHEELRNKIRNLVRSITNNSSNYDEKYMKIRINANGDLPLK